MKTMREYKIESDLPADELRDEDILKYKDFGTLTTNYQQVLKRVHKKPLYKDPKAFLALVLLIIIVYLIVESEEAVDPAPEDTPAPTEQVD